MATRRGAGPERALQDSIDSLTSAFDRLATRLETIESGGGLGASDGDRVVRHIRRYMPFYALGTVFALLVLILPTRDSADNTETAAQVTSGETASENIAGGPVDLGTDTSTPETKTSGVSGPTGTKVAAAAPRVGAGPKPATSAAFDPTGWDATGKTIAGFECKNGIRQIPWSSYAAPCYPKWSGRNGGSTSFGVTEKEITIVIRRFPETANSQAVEAAQVAAGFASTDVARAVNEVFRNYLNKLYEMWGRKVKWVIYESQYGDSTAEAQSKGKEGACADATYIKNNLKPFAIYGGTGGSNVFAECAAERGLVTFWGGAYFPERWYDKYHPYVWHTTMDCERISRQVAEYIAKRLANRPAKWAKSTLKDKKRKFGTYVPNNDEYQYCTDVTEASLEKQGVGAENRSRYNYTLDISRFPDEASRGIIKFAAEGVTTVVMACDPISMIFLTQNAKAQNFYPEWFNIGVAANDTDNFPRTWDAEEIRNSLFGMSQLGATHKILGPKAEAPVTYKKATGTNIPEGTEGGYNQLTFIYSALQAAGPNLTPQSLAEGIWSLPPGGAPDFNIGYVSYRDGPDGTPGATDHTGIDDSREVWWDPNATSYDGEKGAYIENYGGKRFRNGQWPKGDPPVFTK